MIRRHAILIAGVVADGGGRRAAHRLGRHRRHDRGELPLLLVAPLVAQGTDALRGRLSTSVVGIVQSGFGNIAEFAITILALRANLPEVVKIAIVGSLLGNAVLLGGLAGLLPWIRGGFGATLCFERRLFSGITTLSIIAFVPMAILTVPSDLLTGNRQGVTLTAGIALTVVGVFFVLMELRAPHMPAEKHEELVVQAVLPRRRGLPRHRRCDGGADRGVVRGGLRAGNEGDRHPDRVRRARDHPACSATWPRTTSRCATRGRATAMPR